MKLGKWRATPGTDLEDRRGTDLPSSGSPGCINPFPGAANRQEQGKEEMKNTSKKAPGTLGPSPPLPERSTNLATLLPPNTQSHLPGRGRQANLAAAGAAASSLGMNHPPTPLQAAESHYARAPPPGTTAPLPQHSRSP